MRLEPLYSVVFHTPESWEAGDRLFLLAEGRAEGALAGRFRAANYPRRRADGALLPDFRGAIETDAGAVVLFALQGVLRAGAGMRRLVGSVTHETGDAGLARLNDTVCPVTGEVRERPGGGFEVALEVAELVV
jgi:hypothetical protein